MNLVSDISSIYINDKNGLTVLISVGFLVLLLIVCKDLRSPRGAHLAVSISFSLNHIFAFVVMVPAVYFLILGEPASKVILLSVLFGGYALLQLALLFLLKICFQSQPTSILGLITSTIVAVSLKPVVAHGFS